MRRRGSYVEEKSARTKQTGYRSAGDSSERQGEVSATDCRERGGDEHDSKNMYNALADSWGGPQMAVPMDGKADYQPGYNESFYMGYPAMDEKERLNSIEVGGYCDTEWQPSPGAEGYMGADAGQYMDDKQGYSVAIENTDNYMRKGDRGFGYSGHSEQLEFPLQSACPDIGKHVAAVKELLQMSGKAPVKSVMMDVAKKMQKLLGDVFNFLRITLEHLSTDPRFQIHANLMLPKVLELLNALSQEVGRSDNHMFYQDCELRYRRGFESRKESSFYNSKYQNFCDEYRNAVPVKHLAKITTNNDGKGQWKGKR